MGLLTVQKRQIKSINKSDTTVKHVSHVKTGVKSGTKKLINESSNSKSLKKTKPVKSDSHHSTHNSTHNKPKPDKSIYQNFLKLEHDLPLGIRVLSVYVFLLALLYFIVGISLKKAMIFGMFFGGIPAFLVNSLTIGLLLWLIYGFAKKDLKHYYFSVIFFVLIILNTLLSIFAVRGLTTGVLRGFVNFSFTLTLILNIITLLFIISKKYYFIHPKPEYHVHGTDKLFILSLILVWITLILGTLFYGNTYYDESFEQVDTYLFNLYDAGVIESIQYCAGVDNSDLCYYIAANLNYGDPNVLKLCDSIKFPLFYLDCVRGASNE